MRAGAVAHLSEWAFGGYSELQNNKQRYTVTDRDKLMNLLALNNFETLKTSRQKLVEAALKNKHASRDPKWTESVAVGNERFVRSVQTCLGIRARGRSVIGDYISGNESFRFKETQVPYGDVFLPSKRAF